jgi:hypothetical protein
MACTVWHETSVFPNLFLSMLLKTKTEHHQESCELKSEEFQQFNPPHVLNFCVDDKQSSNFEKLKPLDTRQISIYVCGEQG